MTSAVIDDRGSLLRNTGYDAVIGPLADIAKIVANAATTGVEGTPMCRAASVRRPNVSPLRNVATDFAVDAHSLRVLNSRNYFASASTSSKPATRQS